MSLARHKILQVFSNIINVIPQINIYSRMMILADVNEYVNKMEDKIQNLEKRIDNLEHRYIKSNSKITGKNNYKKL